MPTRTNRSEASPESSPPHDEDFKTRLIDSSPDCIKVLDLEGHLLSMNAGGMKLLEICNLKPFVGALWTDFWQGADREAAAAAVQTARGGGVGKFVGLFHTVETRSSEVVRRGGERDHEYRRPTGDAARLVAGRYRL